MPDVVKVLKQEISRLARKEVKFLIEPLSNQMQDLRKTIREQKKEIVSLQQEIDRKADKRPGSIKSEPLQREDEKSIRISADSIRKHRDRLGLSQRELGLLIGVSTLTVSKWETNKARPRGRHRLAIAEFRKLGKREVNQRLGMLAEQN